MINLWYEESYWGHAGGRVSGPEKVVKNTIDALEQEGIEYAINDDTYSYNFLMQYQHGVAHLKHQELEHSSCVIGPQVWPFDSYGKFLIENPQYYKNIIAPSEWVKNLFENKLGISKVVVWPVGIKEPNIISNQSIDCLIYYKNRPAEHLEQVKSLLSKRGLTHVQLQYGSYSQDEFKDALAKVQFCIIIDNTESQGIAIQEMMAVGKPLFVWDINEWDYMGEQYKVPATSVPYWSDECGEKFYFVDELEETFERFYDRIDTYNPKNLIDSELSYKASMKKLLNIFGE